MTLLSRLLPLILCVVCGSANAAGVGKLVLWSATPGFVDDRGEVLGRGDFRHLAIANPKVAVYGAAAVEVMTKLGVYQQVESKFVLGESITQAYQFAASGNAELGFVALSQIYKDGEFAAGSHWTVPPGLSPILKQDAVLLTRGKGNPAADALLAYLKSGGEENHPCLRLRILTCWSR